MYLEFIYTIHVLHLKLSFESTDSAGLQQLSHKAPRKMSDSATILLVG